MKFVIKSLQLLYSLYAFALFIILMIPVFVWAVIVTPLGKITGGNLLYKACSLWGDIWCFLIFIRHKNIYEEPLQKGASYIFVSNHISYFDIPVIVKTFRMPIRPLGKAEIAKLPLFGFIYKNAIVTVERSSAPNRAKSVALLKSILRKGISVLVFPEGTFNETAKPLKEFYDGAFRIAIETSTPIVPVLMLDTHDRLHYKSIFSLTPGKSRSVFLTPILTEGLTTRDAASLKDKIFALMDERLRQYNASWIKD